MTESNWDVFGRRRVLSEAILWRGWGHFTNAQAHERAEVRAELRLRFALAGFSTGHNAICVLYHTQRSPEQTVLIDQCLEWKAPDRWRIVTTIMSRYLDSVVVGAPCSEVLAPACLPGVFPAGIDLVTAGGDTSSNACINNLDGVTPHLTATVVMLVSDYRSGPPDAVALDSSARSTAVFAEVSAETPMRVRRAHGLPPREGGRVPNASPAASTCPGHDGTAGIFDYSPTRQILRYGLLHCCVDAMECQQERGCCEWRYQCDD